MKGLRFVLSVLIFTVFVFIINSPVQSADIVNVTDGKLMINNKPFCVKAVCYEPVKPGLYYNGMDWGDESIYERDFPKILGMGFNTIRVYHNSCSKALFKQAELHGLWVCPTFLIEGNVDFENAGDKQYVKEKFADFVNAFKNEPALLFWIIGNEQNYTNGNCAQWYSFANEIAGEGLFLEGLNSHPYAICEGDIGNIGKPEFSANDASLPNISVWACNVYRGSSLDDFFSEYEQLSGKALFISEYGSDSWYSNNIYYPENGFEDQEMQNDIDLALWQDIKAQGAPVIGGSVFSYSDGWWKDMQGDEKTHEYGGIQVDAAEDGFFNEEYWGLVKINANNGIEDKQAASGFRSKVKIFVKAGAPLNGTGSENNPFPTIQKAVESAKDGDTIQILPGTYQLNSPLGVIKCITFIGDIENNSVIKITAGFNVQGKALINVGRNSQVNFLGLYIDGPVFVGKSGINNDKSRVVFRNCYVKKLETFSYSNTVLMDCSFCPYYRSNVLATQNSVIKYGKNKNVISLYIDNAKGQKVPPCPVISASSDTIIQRNGNYQNVQLNLSWNELNAGVNYKVEYILVNVPQGYSSAHKNGSVWGGGQVSITGPSGAKIINETLAVHNWRDILWVFSLKDSGNNLLRTYVFKPKTVLKSASIDKILRRNNNPIENINFTCEWENLQPPAGCKLSYILKGNSGAENAVYDWDNEVVVDGITGPSGVYSTVLEPIEIKDYIQNDLLWVVKLKNENGILIDEVHFIPETILHQSAPKNLLIGQGANYSLNYFIKSRTMDVNGDFVYEIAPDSQCKLECVLIEAETGNYWVSSWDNDAGAEWSGDKIVDDGIRFFNPVTIKKNLTVYDYKKFIWASTLYDENGKVIDKSLDLVNIE